jgi:hypothetical protein
MEIEEEYITQVQETPSMSVYKLDSEDATENNDDEMVDPQSMMANTEQSVLNDAIN